MSLAMSLIEEKLPSALRSSQIQLAGQLLSEAVLEEEMHDPGNQEGYTNPTI